MELKAKDADRMNLENDMFIKKQQQIMQLELAEAAKDQKSVSPEVAAATVAVDALAGVQASSVMSPMAKI